jgi:hypothetical protein
VSTDILEAAGGADRRARAKAVGRRARGAAAGLEPATP